MSRSRPCRCTSPPASISARSPVRYQPSAVNAAAVAVWVAPVTGGHVGASHLELALGGDAELDAADGSTDAPEDAPRERVRRNERCALGGAVALDHPDPHPLPRARQVRIETCATAEDELERAAELARARCGRAACGRLKGSPRATKLSPCQTRHLPWARTSRSMPCISSSRSSGTTTSMFGRRRCIASMIVAGSLRGDVRHLGAVVQHREDAGRLLEHVRDRE